MKRSAIFLLSMLMSLMIEPLSPWRAQERRPRVAEANVAREAVDARPHPALTVAHDEGSFQLKNLRLVAVGGSTKLRGQLVNQTRQRWESIVFALRAYDRNGKLLRGVERRTIFGFSGLRKGETENINSGYGVWLEGIPLRSIARVEVVLLDEAPTAHSGKKILTAAVEE